MELGPARSLSRFNVCYVIGPSGLERREITPGESTLDLIEVTDGLNEGESVVLNPTRVFDRSPWLAARRADLIHFVVARGTD